MVEGNPLEPRPLRVVVGYDGSRNAMAALKWAADYASHTKADVTLVAAWDAFVVLGAPVSLRNYNPQRELKRAVQTAVAELDLPLSKIHVVIEQGKPSQLLVDASRDADLLVVGQRGVGGFEHLVLGSVSSYCLSHAACTVCIIPPRDE